MLQKDAGRAAPERAAKLNDLDPAPMAKGKESLRGLSYEEGVKSTSMRAKGEGGAPAGKGGGGAGSVQDLLGRISAILKDVSAEPLPAGLDAGTAARFKEALDGLARSINEDLELGSSVTGPSLAKYQAQLKALEAKYPGYDHDKSVAMTKERADFAQKKAAEDAEAQARAKENAEAEAKLKAHPDHEGHRKTLEDATMARSATPYIREYDEYNRLQVQAQAGRLTPQEQARLHGLRNLFSNGALLKACETADRRYNDAQAGMQGLRTRVGQGK